MSNKSIQAAIALSSIGKKKANGSIGGIDALKKQFGVVEEPTQSDVAEKALQELSNTTKPTPGEYEASFFGEEVADIAEEDTVVVQIAISGGKVKVN